MGEKISKMMTLFDKTTLNDTFNLKKKRDEGKLIVSIDFSGLCVYA